MQPQNRQNVQNQLYSKMDLPQAESLPQPPQQLSISYRNSGEQSKSKGRFFGNRLSQNGSQDSRLSAQLQQLPETAQQINSQREQLQSPVQPMQPTKLKPENNEVQFTSREKSFIKELEKYHCNGLEQWKLKVVQLQRERDEFFQKTQKLALNSTETTQNAVGQLVDVPTENSAHLGKIEVANQAATLSARAGERSWA